MNDDPRKTIRDALAALTATHRIVVEQFESAITVLSSALDASEWAQGDVVGATREDGAGRPIADRNTLSILWHGRSCFLGNTLLFRFFERIARSSNRYVPHVDLLDEVWGTHREATTIRGVAKRLRDRLIASGMADLARAIDGSVSGHYRLMLV